MNPLIPVLCLLVALPLAGPTRAHEGHDHAEPPPVVADWAPRAAARSELFDLVLAWGPAADSAANSAVESAVESAAPPELRLWLDGADNRPISDARIQLELNAGQPDAWQAEARPVGAGAYVLSAPPLARPGSYALTATVTRGDDLDLLPLQLVVPAPAQAEAAHLPALNAAWWSAAGLAGMLALGAGLVWQQRRRAR